MRLPPLLSATAALLASVPQASAWIATAQLWPTNASGLWRPEKIAMRLGAVSAVWDDSIVSGGIPYAWDPSLCARLLERFGDDVFVWQFVSCESLRQSLERAFAVWAANHPVIRFRDVSHECDALPSAATGRRARSRRSG